MKRYLYPWLLAAGLCAAQVGAEGGRISSQFMPTCTDGAPWSVYVVDATDASDCDITPSGTAEAQCRCLDGVIAAVTSGSGSGAPTTLDYFVGTATGSLSAERVGTDTASIDVDLSTAGQVKFNVITPVASASDLTCTNCIGGTEIDESALGAVPTATNALGVSGFTATKCARFDGSGALVAASGDCSAGDTDFDTKVIFDIGDDGGNDSTAVTEIASVSDDYSAMTEPSADKISIDFAKLPPYREYDPDRPSATCWGGTGALCEEFQGNAEALTWRWGNQGTSTQSLVLDRSLLTPQAATTTLRARWTTPPSATNWAITTKFSQVHLSGTGLAGSGPVVLEAGSEATPTAISGIFLQYKNSVPWGSARAYSKTSYTSASTVIGSLVDVHNSLLATSVYAQIRYVTGTKTLTYFVSYNGLHWFAIGSARVLGAGPVSVGYASETSGATTTCQDLFSWWRLRTDSAGTSGNYECGE